jgi:uncharacterized OB-fold protein
MSTDPRPEAAESADGTVVVSGWRCTACSLPLTQPVLRCPQCRQQVREETFASEGVVFASTCMRVGVPGHEPPYAIAYVVLDDGPRVFVHSPGDTALPPGSRARLSSLTAEGDLVAVAVAEEVAA